MTNIVVEQQQQLLLTIEGESSPESLVRKENRNLLFNCETNNYCTINSTLKYFFFQGLCTTTVLLQRIVDDECSLSELDESIFAVKMLRLILQSFSGAESSLCYCTAHLALRNGNPAGIQYTQ